MEQSNSNASKMTIHTQSLGLVAPVPSATTYVTVRTNVAKEDDKRLRFVPYFGENDKSNFDISHYSEDEEEEEPEELQDDAVITAIIGMRCC